MLCSLLWGTADVANKLAMDAVPPITLAASRFVIALGILWVIARRTGGGRVPARVAAPLGLLGVTLRFLLQNLGLEKTAVTNATVLQGAVPVLTVVLAVAFLGESLSRRRVAALSAAVLGVAAVTLTGASGLSAPSEGDLLVWASTLCFSTFIVLGRRAFPVYGTFPVLAGMAAWGTAALMPFAAVELWFTPPTGISFGQVAIIIYLGAGCSALTYALWGYALCHLQAARAAIFNALIPVVGIVAAVVVLHEAPAIWQLTGGGLVVGAVWLMVREPEPVIDGPARPSIDA